MAPERAPGGGGGEGWGLVLQPTFAKGRHVRGLGVGCATNPCQKGVEAEGWGLVPQPTFGKLEASLGVGGWLYNQPCHKVAKVGGWGLVPAPGKHFGRQRLGGWWLVPALARCKRLGVGGLVVGGWMEQRLGGGGWLWVGGSGKLPKPKNPHPFPWHRADLGGIL